MSTYHLPKPHHTPPIQYGEIIETECDLRIQVKSAPHSVTVRDTNMGGNAEACGKCVNSLVGTAIRMAYAGDEMMQGSEVQQDQATA